VNLFRLKYALVFVCIAVMNLQAQNDFYLSLSTIKAKPLSMASAYTSVEDNLASAIYNPASIGLFNGDKNFRVTFFLNPVAPVSAFRERYREQAASQADETRSVWQDALVLFKGVIFTIKFLDIGFLFNEQIIDPVLLSGQKEFFSYYDFSENISHSAIVHLRLAERVSLGASTTLFMQQSGDQTQRGYGFSYGILMKPAARMNVGISYHYLPRLMPDVRIPLEKMVDQTINVGISYYPLSSTTLSMDLRNLTEEKGKSVIELRFGAEQRVFSLFALRGGYFKERFSDLEQISAGIGMIDANLFFPRKSKLQHSPFVLNYAFVLERTKTASAHWHVVTFNVVF